MDGHGGGAASVTTLVSWVEGSLFFSKTRNADFTA
jgi:hypothetical protein